jgi:predicted LPLAT superfamily acyltransferase
MSAAVPHWSHLRESTSVAGMRFLCAVHRRLGRWPFRACLYPVLVFHWIVRPSARRASLEYLAQLESAHGVFGCRPGWRHGLRHFRQFAETLLDKMLAMGGRYPLDNVRLEGQALLLEQLGRGRGALIVTAHVGCLELCQVLTSRVPGFRLTALVHTAHAEQFNEFMRQLQPANRVELLQVTEVGPATAQALAERVAAGGFVAIAGDRVPVRGGSSLATDFLGRPAHWPVGPYVLAALLECPVYLMCCTREPAGYLIRFERHAERIDLPRRARQPVLQAEVERFAARVEAWLRAAPYDWFNFFPFWDQVSDDLPRT